MAKKAKNKGVSDRISSFPDPILCHILSFLPGKDAVRSSVLSSRWRYLYTSMSTVDFDNYLKGVREKNFNNFKSFVDRLFFYPNQVSLECFRVDDSWVNVYWANPLSRDDDDLRFSRVRDDYLRLYGWICAALWRGVKEVDIYCKVDSDLLELPNFLWTCQSLVTLKLDMDYIDVPPSLCLPNLKTLHLTKVQFTGGVEIHRLISSLHVLVDLVITSCQFFETSELNIHNLSLKRLVLDFGSLIDGEFDFVIVINAPSLVYFRYIDILSEGYTLSTMNSLERADISIMEKYEVDRVRGASATQLLQGICNVTSLSLSTRDFGGFKMLPRRLLDEHITFDNLVELKLGHYHADWSGKGTWLIEFLHCMPNLKTLILRLVVADEGYGVLLEEVPSCLSFHLKEITILKFKESEHIFELISYFLNNAIVLEKLALAIEALSAINQLSILKKLLKLPKKSMKCQIVTF